jgi:hypothetical protein
MEGPHLVLPKQRVPFSPDVHDGEAVTIEQSLSAFPSHGHVEFATLSSHFGTVAGENR